MAQALVKGFNLQGKSEMPFTDIFPSYAQYKNIEILYHHRITTGTTPTTYNPYSPVSRQQFTTFIIYR
ncbi:MAG TPA: S-layer homology domain-containing protein [Ureibacillus sp.]|nr:S-layer homology domain-containing protein [Ureibacillus sp.]